MPDPGRVIGPVIIPNTIEVQLRWELANSKVVHNVLHGRVAGGFSATATIAEAIRTAVTSGAGWTDFAAELHTSTSLLAVALRDLRTANMPLVDSTGVAAAGTAAGGAMPPEVALVVTLRTALAGRGFRGRVYLPGFDKTAVTAAGVATAGAMTAALAFIQHVQAGMSASGLTLGIAQQHRAAYTSAKTGRHYDERAATIIDVTDVVVRDNVFDSQRRRSR